MAEVSKGPVSTLPGHKMGLPPGTICDTHPDRLAVARVQGETDSFGCEYNDLCKECLAYEREMLAQTKHGKCDWCKSIVTTLRPRRDYDEGMSGPVYMVCEGCVIAENKRLAEEESDYDDRGDYDDLED
jgi:hypothetical protein